MKTFHPIILIVIFGVLGCVKEQENCVDTNCIDYTSQAAAQLDYDSNPECRADLDADNDGIACEESEWINYYNNLNNNNGGNGGNGCPTTAACGCSNKTKAECEADPCCDWTVGEGCGCA